MRKSKKENFYHGILLGLLSHQEDWYIRSNAESGEGYSDILVEIEEEGIGIVIEVKYPDSGKKALNSQEMPANSGEIAQSSRTISASSAELPQSSRAASLSTVLEKGCEEALHQIEKMGYEEKLRQDGLETILKYGIACSRKKCKVLRDS